MFVNVTNDPRDYAWGSTGAVSALLGRPATDAVEAELWLGTHPGSPARVVGSGIPLVDELGQPLPFLLKVLAAASALSLQAHPTAEQAREGFARENAAGIPVDAPHRNYRDPFPKPELIYAVSETFEALCGFRPIEETLATLDELETRDAASDDPTPALFAAWRSHLTGPAPLRTTFAWLIAGGDEVDALVARVVALADRSTPELATVLDLAMSSPGDPGIVISVLLHHVRLRAGEALFLPAGNIHAYLRGLGIELMTASDNVLRGGLTPKHVDVPELMRVLDFRAVDVPRLTPRGVAPSVTAFAPEGVDFALLVVEGEASVPGDSSVLLVTEGAFTVTGRSGARSLHRGDALVAHEEGAMTVTGSGRLYVASTALAGAEAGV